MFRHRFVCVALASSAAIAVNPGAARADVVLDWNVIALRTTAAAPFNPPLETRNLAIVHAAIFDAVNSIDRQFHKYAVMLPAPDWASQEAAAIAAAHTALVQLYPAQRPTLDAEYDASLSQIPDGAAKTIGVAVGRGATLWILAKRASDGSAAAITAPYTPGNQPGDWNPTPPAFLPALDPGWGSVQPFVLRSGSQ